MELSNLRPAEGSKHSDNFRRGRGHGSGNGKTAGKGHKEMCIRDRVKVSRVQSREMDSPEDLWLTVPNIIVMQVPMVLVLIRARYSKENTCQVIWEMFRLLYRTLRLYA